LKSQEAEAGAGAGPTGAAAELGKQLPLLSLATTKLSFATLTMVLFRIAFKYR
jgi:hypothetical protein